ncbi:GrrA/OscA1 family cyclophane-containing rSAM-modified RiPP [Urbifossiella limnaea]|uniref:Uncharacterized protein n=1 Tax=Urbifossiella limnaea TaxID=2528023 RepID=A0A517XXK7_9BACT|nr:GrrA/OscA1 family cyclophane-containing rSAM-modified RiPP [Urbifossiella limnaea]QDU22267.1 hypothetical protein ETAA1_42440 [Urbifossiella limnaea]
MAPSDRRRFLKDMLGTLAGAAGTVVLASTATGQEAATPPAAPADDIQDRADRIAGAAGATEEEVSVQAFVNGAFRNAVGGGFRNGGFANGFGGGFRNGSFRNGVSGGFRNGAFRNW